MLATVSYHTMRCSVVLELEVLVLSFVSDEFLKRSIDLACLYFQVFPLHGTSHSEGTPRLRTHNRIMSVSQQTLILKKTLTCSQQQSGMFSPLDGITLFQGSLRTSCGSKVSLD